MSSSSSEESIVMANEPKPLKLSDSLRKSVSMATPFDDADAINADMDTLDIKDERPTAAAPEKANRETSFNSSRPRPPPPKAPSENGSTLTDLWRDEEWKKKTKTRLEKEMDVELQKVRANSALEREEAYDNLCNAKDRSQTTSIIAIFILQVGIMKDLLMYSHDTNFWFYLVLGFLIAAIIVTGLAGFLLMAIFSIKTKIKKMSCHMVDATVGYGTFTISREKKLFTGQNTDRDPLITDDEEKKDDFWSKFQAFVTRGEESLEDRLLRMYKTCYIQELQASLDFAHAQSEADKLDRDLVAAAESGFYYRESSVTMELFDDGDPHLEDAKLKSLMEKWHSLKSLRKQGSTLLQRAMEITRRKLFGRLLLLQNWVTHFIFTLCILAILTVAFSFGLTYEAEDHPEPNYNSI